jgi:hypothetical protein
VLCAGPVQLSTGGYSIPLPRSPPRLIEEYSTTDPAGAFRADPLHRVGCRSPQARSCSAERVCIARSGHGFSASGAIPSAFLQLICSLSTVEISIRVTRARSSPTHKDHRQQRSEFTDCAPAHFTVHLPSWSAPWHGRTQAQLRRTTGVPQTRASNGQLESTMTTTNRSSGPGPGRPNRLPKL